MKGLDWTNETWVRLYRSDSPAWRRLKWEAQSVYLGLQRKLDRAGCLSLDGLMDFEAVAEMTGCPEDVAERALPRLYQLGFLVKSEDGDTIVDPEFIERDEAASSDAQRKRDSRARRRDRTMSRSVTGESQNVTEPSHAVTRGHTRSLRDKPRREETEERDPPDLVGDPDGSADDTPDPPSDPKKAAQNGHVQEMRWRIEETWAAHLGMREYYWQDVEFSEKPPGSPPTLTPQRRKLIGEALKRHDKGLLKAEDRERWKAESKTRAAGIGIFLDPWCTARSEGNVLAEGGKRYLEPERAWKIKSGVDQVERFAELYFARKERRRGTS